MGRARELGVAVRALLRLRQRGDVAAVPPQLRGDVLGPRTHHARRGRRGSAVVVRHCARLSSVQRCNCTRGDRPFTMTKQEESDVAQPLIFSASRDLWLNELHCEFQRIQCKIASLSSLSARKTKECGFSRHGSAINFAYTSLRRSDRRLDRAVILLLAHRRAAKVLRDRTYGITMST